MLWVKGSGGDVGTMKLDGFATLYMDKLSALKRLYRGVEHEDEMVGYLPHCTFNLNPRAASIDTPLHAYRAARACRSHASRRDHRHRRVEEFAGADAEDLRRRDRLAALEAARLRARPVAGEILRARTRSAKGVRARQPRPLHLGRHAKECYETTHRASSTRPSPGSRARPRGKPAFGGAGGRSRCRQTERRAHRRAADAGDPRPASAATRRKVGHFDDRAAVLEFVDSQRARPARRARHLLPRPFPAHQDPAAGDRLRSGQPRPRRRRSPASTTRSPPTAPTTPPITTAASTPTARPCAIPTPWSIWCPASA